MALRLKHGTILTNLDLFLFDMKNKFTGLGEFCINSALNAEIHDSSVYFAMEIRTSRRVSFDLKACQEQNCKFSSKIESSRPHADKSIAFFVSASANTGGSHGRRSPAGKVSNTK